MTRFVIYKNRKKINKIFLYEDRLTNGNQIDFFFFAFQDEEFKKGDVINVEMLTIDEVSYTYFKTLKNALATTSGGPFGSAAPTNPTTNWNNNAFGYTTNRVTTFNQDPNPMNHVIKQVINGTKNYSGFAKLNKKKEN